MGSFGVSEDMIRAAKKQVASLADFDGAVEIKDFGDFWVSTTKNSEIGVTWNEFELDGRTYYILWQA